MAGSVIGSVAGSVASSVASGVVGQMFADDGGGQQQQQAYSANAERLYGEQAETARRQREINDEMLALWRNEQLPLIRAEVARAADPARLEQAISTAAGDVKGQYAVAKDQTGRALELAGRNPADPVYAAERNKLEAAQSGDVARAITDARTREQERQRQERLQAIALYGDPVGAAAAAANSAGSLYGAAARGQQLNASLALQGAQANDLAMSRSGYAVGNTVGPAISKAVQQWWKQPSYTYTSGPANMPSPNAVFNEPAYYNSGPGGYYDAGHSYDALGAGGAYRHGGAVHRYAEGGKIEGPGTGTSDSIHAVKRPGTYILSADTVRAIGTKKLRDLMEKAGVREGDGESSDGRGQAIRLSNGEWSMPPEVAKFYGEEFFNKLQQKYHRPVMDDGDGAANGGAVRRRALPRSVEDAILRAVPAAGRV